MRGSRRWGYFCVHKFAVVTRSDVTDGIFNRYNYKVSAADVARAMGESKASTAMVGDSMVRNNGRWEQIIIV